mmetsp:Transcript_23630/g.60690  ORF Transcript_23630/g.60690 Transcript_23630/m.60690 type:complete len:318 (-) Transcript_23630:1833-2786(-)
MAASLRGRSSADKAQWEEYEFDDWIQGGSAVESVKLVDKGRGSVKGRQLSQIIMSNPNLENLTLSRIGGMGNAETTSLSQALALDTNLKYLHISHCAIGDSGAAALGEALAKNRVLEHLELQENGGNWGKALAKGLSVNRGIKQLLYHGPMSKDEAKTLGESLRTNSSLQQLEIVCKRTLAGDDGTATIVSALKANATIDRLCLPGSGAGDQTAAALGESLKHNTSLMYIDLSGNKIGDKGAKVIADALPSNSSLMHLDLSRNKFGKCGAYFLAGGIATNIGLKGLILKCRRYSLDSLCFVAGVSAALQYDHPISLI